MNKEDRIIKLLEEILKTLQRQEIYTEVKGTPLEVNIPKNYDK